MRSTSSVGLWYTTPCPLNQISYKITLWSQQVVFKTLELLTQSAGLKKMIPQQELVWLKLFIRWIFPMSNMKSVTWQMTYGHPKMPHFRVIVADILPPNTSYRRPVKDRVTCYPRLAGTRSGRGLFATETGLATTNHRANRGLQTAINQLTCHTEDTQPDSDRTLNGTYNQWSES